MSSSPRFSVMTIFLDPVPFLAEAIESVIAQTSPDWELLLIDDGSTDGSSEIARAYASRDPRIRYFEHEGHRNRGTGASRNLAIEHSRGEFIAMLDADDVYLPRKLERQAAILDEHPEVGMVCGATLYWYSWYEGAEDTQEDRIWTEFGAPPETSVSPPGVLKDYVSRGGTVPCPCGVLVRKSLVDHIGGFEEEFSGLYEDQVLFAKVALNAPVYFSSETLDWCRRHPESMCAIAPPEARHSARRLFISWLEPYLDASPLDTTAVRAAIAADRTDLDRRIFFQSMKRRFSGAPRLLKTAGRMVERFALRKK
jgi:glycosyltransferase involved in cell wall biosynthesis